MKILELLFIKKVVLLIDDHYKTKDFGGKSMCFLYIGDENVNGVNYICGFESSPSTISDPSIMKKIWKELSLLDTAGKIQRIRNIYDIPSIKIPKDLIVNRAAGPGSGPISMFNSGPELWSSSG